jgi:hypothetical protein
VKQVRFWLVKASIESTQQMNHSTDNELSCRLIMNLGGRYVWEGYVSN